MKTDTIIRQEGNEPFDYTKRHEESLDERLSVRELSKKSYGLF